MNKLATVAIEAVTDPNSRALGEAYPLGKGLCQKFVRLCLAEAYGREVSEKFRADSAKLAADLWLKSGHGFRSDGVTLQYGDVLYKVTGSGGFGHVGIYTPKGVAENSSTATGRVRGALGFRTLAQFGHFDVVGRWPEVEAVKPTAPPAIILVRGDSTVRLSTQKDGGNNWAPVRSTLDAAGVVVSREGIWGDGNPVFYLKD